MVESLRLGVFNKATHYHPICFLYVWKLFLLSSLMQAIEIFSVEYPSIGAALELLTYSLRMIVYFFVRLIGRRLASFVEILGFFEAASRQKITLDKSSMTFSHNTPVETREEVLEVLGPMQELRRGKYLGLPSVIGKSKNQVFAEIKEKVGKKLSGWKKRMLSVGGKEILIKAVTQAIPTYTMSCFQLPKGLCEDLERMERNFWCGQRDQEAKIAWVSWRKICKSKSEGGMGFRNLQAFNLAMLVKQAWRIMINPNSLIVRIYKAKYFPYSDILGTKLGCNPFYAWRSIYNNLEVINRGIRWRVGNGKMIHI